MKRLYTVIASLLFMTCGYAQSWQDDATSGDNFYEIVKQCEARFDKTGRGKQSGYKQFQRWKGEMQYRVDGNGKMTNDVVRNYEAVRRMERRQSAVSDTMRTTHGEWTDLGPFDYFGGDVYSGGGVGRVNCTAFHPTDTSTFWIGTPAGGLWKTTDAGSSWIPMTDHFPSIGISGIAVHPTHPDTIYILTGDGDGRDSPSIGVLKTTNGGITWDKTGLEFEDDQRFYGFDLVMNPSNPDILYTGMWDLGIYRTADGGQNWTQVDSNKRVWDIEFQPGNPAVLYAASSAGFLKSVDNGITWAVDSDPDFPTEFARIELAVSPSSPSTVYVVFGGATGVLSTFNGLYKSTDYGAEFSQQATTPNILDGSMSGSDSTDQAGYDLCIVVDPVDDTRVFVGGVNMWKSEDSGVTWGRETWWTKNFEPLDPYVHADWHNMYFQGSTLYANVDGGIYQSTDYGNDWSELTAGLSLMQFYEIEILGDMYMGGSQDNGTNEAETTNPQTHSILGGDGFGGAWHWGNTSTQYISSQDRLARRQLGANVFIWEETNGFWRTDIKMHKTDADYLFFDKYGELFRAKQDGPIWSFQFDSLKTLAALPDSAEILGYVQGDGANDNVMYVVNRSTILKTTELDSNPPAWTIITKPVADSINMSDVIIDPLNPDKVWIACSGYTDGMKVFYSGNNGGSWTNISGSLPNVPVHCMTYHPGTNDGVYLGTEIGVFYKTAAMSDWVYFSNLLPKTVVKDIEVEGNFVYAGTFGRGIWQSETYSSCPTDLVLTPGNAPGNPLSLGRQEYSASNTITTTRIVDGNFADIRYSAGDYVDMLSGFWSKEGNFMHAKADGCPD